MKTIILRSIFVTLGLLFSILLAESILRVADAAKIVSIDPNKSFANDPFIYSSSLKYRIKPYLKRECTVSGNPEAICYANKYGHRDKDHNFHKSENTYRILFLGDSLTYGPGVNDDSTYPKIFERQLKKSTNSKKNYEVLNMGMIFYGPEQYYNLYNELGKHYKPDLIILSFHLLTDAYDAYEYDANRKFYQLKALPDLLPHEINQPLKEQSYVWRTLLSAYYAWANKQDANVFTKVFNGKSNRFQYETQLNTTAPFMKKGWELSENYISKLVSESNKNNTKIVIIGFSTPVQVDPDAWKKLKSEGLIAEKQMYDNSAARKKFLEICKRHGWPCIELQDDLRKAKDPKKLFLQGDIHYTKEGNTIAANAAYTYLKNKKIID